MAKFKSSIEEGLQGEKRFSSIIKSFGLVIKEASFKENVHDHIDFFVKGKTKKLIDFHFSVDVKADKIAFETEAGFLMVDREELTKWCEEKVDFKRVARKAHTAIYKVYTRKGREDLISRIKTEDIRNLSSCRLLA